MNTTLWIAIGILLLFAVVAICATLVKRSDGGKCGLLLWLPLTVFAAAAAAVVLMAQSDSLAALAAADGNEAQLMWIGGVFEWVEIASYTSSAVIGLAGLALLTVGFRLPDGIKLADKTPLEGKLAAATLPLACIIAFVVAPEFMNKTGLIIALVGSIVGGIGMIRLTRAEEAVSRRMAAAISLVVLLSVGAVVFARVAQVRQIAVYLVDAPPPIRAAMVQQGIEMMAQQIPGYIALAAAVLIVSTLFARLDRARSGNLVREFVPAAFVLGLLAGLIVFASTQVTPVSGVYHSLQQQCDGWVAECLERGETTTCQYAANCVELGTDQNGDPEAAMPLWRLVCENPATPPYDRDEACRRLP